VESSRFVRRVELVTLYRATLQIETIKVLSSRKKNRLGIERFSIFD